MDDFIYKQDPTFSPVPLVVEVKLLLKQCHVSPAGLPGGGCGVGRWIDSVGTGDALTMDVAESMRQRIFSSHRELPPLLARSVCSCRRLTGLISFLISDGEAAVSVIASF